ncbi:Insulin-degrading enzyme [Mycena indigotica]|uniref:Insulin-degrading enzyme n=1 Tax=Mycena indigotica TaxID=2126181 RepID=A0A8H6VXF9_9AGAR|nr:Insulin-degrading enzyme [Mycena indigotica]KAF7295456.1 Insulin-degrading enzyme [Mycena indigotica]
MATTADWTRVNPTTAPPFSVFNKPLQQSAQDDRDYRLIRLENGLEAILVHDYKADKAAASLDVAVGHLHDPDDMPGLAHFCEHLLFMGTEQFPKENEYSEYLSKNNGSSNAYTATSNTNYHFNVATTALSGALERFSGFFHSPLFAPSCTSRELNAVDSEHKKNHQQDMWRIFQLSKHLSVEGHEWRKFGSGNRESLSEAAKRLKARGRLESQTANGHLAASPIPSRLASPAPSVSSVESESEADGGAIGRETRRRLIEWWSNEYCASRMRLCVIGTESLDELAEMASRLFSPIVNRGADPLPMVTSSPIGPDQKGTFVAVQTIMAFRSMELSFPAEWQPPFWRHKPLSYISHFVGHEGPGSIHSYLKNKGYITALGCSPQNLARGLAAFKITLTLTVDGLQNHREVALAVFKYLSLLRNSTLEPFHQKEQVQLSEIKFRFKEKSRPDSYATWVAESMTRPVPPELTLSSSSLVWDWGEDGFGESKVREYLAELKPENVRITLMAKADEHLKLAPNAVWEKEPWYGTEYFVNKLDSEFLQKAQEPNDIPEFHLPGPNLFIPTNVEVDKREVTEARIPPAKRAYHIRETPLSSLWHKKDDKFWVPKAFAIMDLRSPYDNSTARASVLTRLYADIINDSLTEYSYDASLAMLEYRFIAHSGGLYVAINGYNDKMSVLVQQVLEKIKNIVVDPSRLEIMKEQVKRELENFWLGQSYTLSDHFARYATSEIQWSTEEMLQELPTTTAEELQKHIRLLLSEVHMRIVVSGNVYKDEAIRIAETMEHGLSPSSRTPTELNEHALILPRGTNHTWTCVIPNPNQANSALTYFVHLGSVVDQHLRVTSSLLVQLLQEPAFNVLRTKEQLGYIVSCSGWVLPGSVEKGIRFVVQSEKMPGYLEDRVEAFLDAMKTTIEQMSPETFAEHKESVRKRWTESEKNITEEVTRLASHVMSGHYDFLRNEKDAEYIANVSKDDVLRLFLSDVHPASKTRAKLSIHMRSQKKRQPRISPAAADAFTALVREKALVGVSDAVLEDAPRGDEPHEPTDFGKYWLGVLGTSPDGQELLKTVPGLIAKFPVPGEGEDPPRPGVTYLTDLGAFRKTLTASVDPGPLVDWPDLPISKF